MSEVHVPSGRSHDASNRAVDHRTMVPLWAIFLGILALQALVVAIGFRFLG